MAEETEEYGTALYPTFIGSNLDKDLIIDAFKVALNKAIESGSPLYFTVISGKPPVGPKPPGT